MNLFVTLQSQPVNGTTYWKVVPTKFNREVGDAMVVDGLKFTVTHVGDRAYCAGAMSELMNRFKINRAAGYLTRVPIGQYNERAKL
jgi:riboflavin synthase alpha subunit